MDAQYQLLPDLTDEEYQALKADIEARGVQVPVERDETGAVLDGHHRIRACEELGITDYPTIIRTGMDEDQKRQHVLALNLDRRHLTQQQKRELVARLLVAKPDVSNRQIAEAAKVSHHTVADVREDMQATGQIAQLDRTVGADGKARPAHKPTAVITTTPKQTQAALDILQTSGTEPPKAMSTVADLKQAARYEGAAQREADVKAKAEAFDGTDLLMLLQGDFREQTASIAVHKTRPCSFLWEAKTKGLEPPKDEAINLDLVTLIANADVNTGGRFLFIHRNQHTGCEVGFWMDQLPPVSEVTIPDAKWAHHPIKHWYHWAAKKLFPEIKVSTRNAGGSNDPFVKIYSEVVLRLPHWSVLVEDELLACDGKWGGGIKRQKTRGPDRAACLAMAWERLGQRVLPL